MTTKEAIAAGRVRMEKAVDDFRKELATLRTGRANASILDAIRVDYHGTPMPVNQLGTVPVPAPTEERRKEIVKHLHKVLENHRTAVRNIRRDVKETIDKLEKEKKISQDEQKRALDEMEKIAHAETKKIEDLSAAKEREILELR